MASACVRAEGGWGGGGRGVVIIEHSINYRCRLLFVDIKINSGIKSDQSKWIMRVALQLRF